MAIKLQIKPEPGWGGHTTYNLAFPAGGIRRPHPRLVIGGRGGGNAWSLSAIVRRDFERKHNF